MKIGYVRTSKKDQNPELQRRDLLTCGCEKFFEEQLSSRKENRPQLRAAMDYCREGDEFVVWKLDRFGRSLRELIELVNELKGRGVEFVSLRESLDTASPGGRHVYHVFGAVAEFKRDLILERTMAGLEAARDRGRKPHAREEDRRGLEADAGPQHPHQRGLRGRRRLAGHALPLPDAGRQAVGAEEGGRGAVMGSGRAPKRMAIRPGGCPG